jgi:hypothetical protein
MTEDHDNRNKQMATRHIPMEPLREGCCLAMVRCSSSSVWTDSLNSEAPLQKRNKTYHRLKLCCELLT